MEEIIKQFGIQWQLLLASIINFFILLFLLKKFLYLPILKILDERKEKIEKSLSDVKKIEEDKIKFEEKVKSTIKHANEEALAIINLANQNAKLIKNKAVEEAALEAKKIISKAKEEIKNEKKIAKEEIKNEMAEIIQNSIKIFLNNKGQIDEEKMFLDILEKIK